MQTDILIVGGGLSGLALADHLAQRGTDFLLVEAQERLGGRILSKEVLGARFDLGPAWFWPGQRRMAALAQRFKIPVFEQYSIGDLMYEDQSGSVQRGRGYDSMQGSYRLAGGMGALVASLGSSLEAGRIMTGAQLQSVRQDPNGLAANLLQIEAEMTVNAKQIVLAMPPRVIADTVTFEPALDSSQMQALGNIPTWMAGQAKIVAVYDTPHWRTAGLSGDAMSQRGPMVEIHDASPMEGGPYALFGFVGVPADAREAHENEIKQMAVAQLTSLFGPEMADPRVVILQDWATLPGIARPQDRAAVRSHPSYGLPRNLSTLSTRGLHFGSTETARGFGGFLEGALEAAERIAQQLDLANAA